MRRPAEQRTSSGNRPNTTSEEEVVGRSDVGNNPQGLPSDVGVTLSAGIQIGQYVVRGPLGSGGMGEVYWIVRGENDSVVRTPRCTADGLHWSMARLEALLAVPFDVTADGQRFLMIKPGGANPESGDRTNIVVVQGWSEELKRAVPAK